MNKLLILTVAFVVLNLLRGGFAAKAAVLPSDSGGGVGSDDEIDIDATFSGTQLNADWTRDRLQVDREVSSGYWSDDEDFMEGSGSGDGSSSDDSSSGDWPWTDDNGVAGSTPSRPGDNNLPGGDNRPNIPPSGGNDLDNEVTIVQSTGSRTNNVRLVDKQTTTRNLANDPLLMGGIVGGVVAGLLCATLLTVFIVYRMRKKDEGSYSLDEPHKLHDPEVYIKASKEFYA